MSSDLPIGKKRYQLNQANAPHIGRMLKSYLKSKRIPAAQLARKLNRSPNTIAFYFKNQSIQTHILWEICVALNYNFLEELSSQLSIESTIKPAPEAEELEKLRIENELLKSLLRR